MDADDAYLHQCSSGRCHSHPTHAEEDEDDDEANNNNNNSHGGTGQCPWHGSSASSSPLSSDQQKALHLSVISGGTGVKGVNDNRRRIDWNANEDQREAEAEEEEEGTDCDLELRDHLNKNFVRNRRYTEHMVRIQAMAMSDEEDDYGEWLRTRDGGQGISGGWIQSLSFSLSLGETRTITHWSPPVGE